MIAAGGLLLVACGESRRAPDALSEWTLGEPAIVLGSLDDGPTAFSSISSVALGPRSELHVSLRQEHEVRVFDQEGAFLGSIGGEGDGPGEFQRPGQIGFVGDTLWVLDIGSRRVSFFYERSLVRTESYPAMDGLHEERVAYPRAVIAGPALLVATDVRLPFQPSVTSQPGLLYRYAFGRFDTLAAIGVDHTNGFLIRGTPSAIEAMAPLPEPFSPAALWDVSNDGSTLTVVDLVEGSSAVYSVTSLTATGDTLSSTIHAYDPISIPAAVVDSMLGRSLARGFTIADAREAAYVPETYPPVSALEVGPGGLIWLAREELLGQAREWLVLSAEGDPLAKLRTPPGFSIRAIDESDVWGLVTDELDVPYLVRRPIIRD